MKRKYLIICFLITGIFACMLSETTALYVWQDQYTLLLTLDDQKPIQNGYLKYEMDSIFEPITSSPSEVSYDEKTGKIAVKGDAGAMKNYPAADDYVDYKVSAILSSVIPSEWKNFGITFNGSYATYAGTSMDGVGNVLKFDQTGNLVIVLQEICNNDNDDRYKDARDKTIYTVASKDVVSEKLKTVDLGKKVSIEIFVDKDSSWEDQSRVYAFINGIRMNETPIILPMDYRGFHTDGSGKNVMIGVSSYQSRGSDTKPLLTPVTSVVAEELYIEDWNGIDFK